MITHQQYRRTLLADPGCRDPEWLQHAAECAECAAYAAQTRDFEARLVRAMRLPVREPRNVAPVDVAAADEAEADDNVVPFRPPGGRGPAATRGGRGGFMRRGRYALAASVLVGAGIAAALWLAAPRTGLADDVVAHMAHEAESWNMTAPVTPQSLAAVMQPTHARLMPQAGAVTYTMSCSFRGHQVPHLVLQSARGPVTVLVLEHETVHREVRFDQQGYRGVIVPVEGHGAVAVLTQSGRADAPAVEAIAAQVVASIDWMP